MQNDQVVLKSRPTDFISYDNFDFVSRPVPELKDGEILVAVKVLSLDPAIRGWMNEGTTYIKGIEIGAVMRTFSAGEVIASKNEKFAVGTHVAGLLGAQKYAVSNGQGLSFCDLEKGPLSQHIGILGMPGMTAYFGLLKRCEPNAGETIFVSGAAGIVGSTVGQIARIKGCTVIGAAGSDAKCNYIKESCGFHHAINYKTENLDAKLKEYAPDGIHMYYDNVGGEMLDTALMNLARGARVTICGAISQYNKPKIEGPNNYMKIVSARGKMNGIIVFDFIPEYPTAVNDISNWLKSGEMQTKEHFETGLENFPKALMMLYTGDNFGKLLLNV